MFRRSSNNLKQFAPISIRMQPSEADYWLRAPLEGNFEFDRTFQRGPDDIFDPYYKFNEEKHHVWTDHLVIKRDTCLDDIKHVASFIGLEDLKMFNQDCLDDPEKHFYVQDLSGEMGRGLFAKHAVPES